jgi:negative regulator of flagellin synthesis FlgM
MKIGQKSDIPAPVTPSVSRPGVGASAKAAASGSPATVVQSSGASAAAQGVPVTVSPMARAFDVASSSSTFDARKVSEVRSAIANGTYRVDPEAIADKLLSNAQQVLRKARS